MIKEKCTKCQKEITILSDSFKGSISSRKICEIWEKEINLYNQQFDSKYNLLCHAYPLGDGGEGSLECYLRSNGNLYYAKTVDALYREIDVPYIVDGDTMVIESATIVGLPLMKDHLEPLQLNTYGIGKMILHGLDLGIKKFILFLGGSSTTDAGIGLAKALGYEFLDENQQLLEPYPLNLSKIHSIDCSKVDMRLENCSFQLAVDVKNPIIGENGCAFTFAPQKGASENDVLFLEKGLKNLVSLLETNYGLFLQDVSGLGAAGGLGLFLYAFHSATICSGIELLMNHLNIDDVLTKSSLIISGEGHFDSQTLNGKLVSHIIQKARVYHVPLFLIVGLNDFAEYTFIDKIITLNTEDIAIEEKMKTAIDDYRKCVKKILKEL